MKIFTILCICVLGSGCSHERVSPAEADFNKWRRLNDREKPKKQDPSDYHVSDTHQWSLFGGRPLFGDNGLLWNTDD
jgi:hypothetical protein